MHPSRFDDTGRRQTTSDRLEVRRLTRANRLWGSNGVTFGPDGRLYVAQFLAGQISAVDPASGDVDVVVPLDGPVQAPDDLAFGADGSMYIADLTPGRVWRRSPGGAYTLVSDQVAVPNGITCVGDRLFVNEMRMNGRLMELFPDGGDPAVLTDGLALGNAMQLGPDGCLYYPQMLRNEVWRIPPDGGVPERVAAEVDDPVAVRFDRGGVLVVLSRGMAGVVTRIDLDTGARSVVATGIVGLDNAAFDHENRMFVSSFASGGIAEIDADGRSRVVVPQGFDGPFGITVDLGGTVYAADHFRLASPEAPGAGSDSGSGSDSGAGSDSGSGSGSGSLGEGQQPGVVTHELMYAVHNVTADNGLLHLTSQLGDVRTHDPVNRTSRVRATGLDQPTGIAVGPDGSLVVAETGAGRILRIDDTDTVSVLAEGLDHPVDIAFDGEQRAYVSDDRRGAVLRLDDGGEVVVVADGLGAPQGLAVRGDELFTVEVAHRRLRAISLTTGESRIDAENLAVGLPPGITRTEPAPVPGVPGRPRQFAGLAVAPDGALLVSANGEGSVLRLTPRAD
ncbi:SMP-30/gluconolactonase/LRE family protein [Streptomyces hygroscopicus subsp. hygroscopicus]|uniref:hypothetical protein n=1 Tax=Streptomyces hygroscopicus TaxID=1912 RepID=UPI001C661D02|nr:hypothetical protein [Streptomyces hygroscopicus]MBW8089274.1 SMP-30/gluconolactonase/LRE family protein [Streptomyces hygroscopicus subsp. hygroscopicus]